MTEPSTVATPMRHLATPSDAAALALGNSARAILDNPAFSRAFTAIEEQLIAAWKSAPTAAQREECHQMVRLAYKLKAIFVDFVSDGLVIADHLDWINATPSPSE